MKAISIIIFAGLFSLMSCSSTQVTSSWKADNASATQIKKVIVLGIIKEKDRTLREEIENQLVAELNKQGYDAHSALQEYGPKAFSKMSEEEIAAKLKKTNYDAVLTTVLLDKSKESNYTPGSTSLQPVGVRYNRFGRYYSTVYDRVYTEGYYTTSTNFFLESNLYDTDTGDLIYSVQSKAFDPSSSASLGNDYANMVIKDMKKKGIVATK